MSIVAVRELPRTGSLNWKVQRTYTRRFQVQSSLQTDSPLTIMAAVDPITAVAIPARLAAYPTDALAKVSDIKVTQESTLYYWTVEVSYTSTFEFDPATTNENPLLRPAIWKFSFEKATKAVRYDLDDEAIDNSAECPIDPPVEMEISIPIISIQINKATLTYSSIATLQDCVNSDVWNGFEVNTVKVRGVEVERKEENGYLYWAFNWTLAVKWDKWRPVKILDMGYSELVGGVPKIIREFGSPLPSPSLLNGAGARLPAGDDPVYLEFNLHREVAFAGVPIP